MFAYIISILLILLGLTTSYFINDEEYRWVRLYFTCLGVLGAIVLGSTLMENEAYKRGQVDALNGEYKYEMKIKEDTSYVEK